MNFHSSQMAGDIQKSITTTSGSLSPLRQRTQNLARPLQEDETQDNLEIVVFRLGARSEEATNTTVKSGLYAFETAQVREVFPIADASVIATLPGTPPWVRGILNVRGHILAVLDLQKLFGLPSTEAINAPVLILRGENTLTAITHEENAVSSHQAMTTTDVALATTGVTGVQLLPRAQLETGHALDGTPGARYLRGLTQDGIALLDAALLFSDAQLTVQSEF